MAERKRLLLRLDPAVHDAIARWAADDLRSINAQIEYALRQALRAAGRPVRSPPTPAEAGPDEPGPEEPEP
jgi:hypothetical protein